ncbi:MAG: molecular chaperone DnaJ [Novosphingobium sp.]
MTKLIILLLVVAFACKQLAGRWPWQLWADSERSQAEAQARSLLGVDRGASSQMIAEAHKRLIARVHPDRGGSSEQVHAANAARDLLLARGARLDMENP